VTQNSRLDHGKTYSHNNEDDGEGVVQKLKRFVTKSSSNYNNNITATSPLVQLSQETISSSESAHGNGDHRQHVVIPIECRACSNDPLSMEAQARAFVLNAAGTDGSSSNCHHSESQISDIVLCSNRLYSKEDVEEVLVHELVHTYDVFINRLNLRKCNDLAYSEIRAAREAECSKVHSSWGKFANSICVKEKATSATRSIFPDEGAECVKNVFKSAMEDLSPCLAHNRKKKTAANNSIKISLFEDHSHERSSER